MSFILVTSAMFLATTTDAAVNRTRVEQGIFPSVWVEGVTWSLADRMRELRVPGVSIAVFRDFAIEWAAGYGVRDAESGAPVTTETLFQAASISKPVSAVGVLALCRDGRLDLDRDVRDYLKAWRLPSTGFDDETPLTLRHLLSHTGSVTVHGFAGYPSFMSAPSAVQVLSGDGVVNSPPVTLDGRPGGAFRYSGGGTTIAQVIVADVGGQSFPDLLHARVLAPLAMTRSTLAQPLPEAQWPDHSAGHLEDGRVQPGRYRVHPEVAAAGLWTTPSDLCRFAIEMTLAHRGESERVLDQTWATAMLSRVGSGPTALGWFVEHRGGEPYFQHGGSNIGFKCQLYSHQTDGFGFAIMTNGENGGQLMQEIQNALAHTYAVDGFVEPPLASSDLDEEDLDALFNLAVGRYELGDDQVLSIWREHEVLYGQLLPQPRLQLVPLADGDFLAYGNDARVRFDEPSDEGFAEVYVRRGSVTQYGERLDDETRHPVEELVAGDIDRAVLRYRAAFAASAGDMIVSDQRLDRLAVMLWNDHHRDAALAIARLATEFYPASAGAWDTLAQYLIASGDNDGAIVAYTRALQAAATGEGNAEMRRVFMLNAEAMLAHLR